MRTRLILAAGNVLGSGFGCDCPDPDPDPVTHTQVRNPEGQLQRARWPERLGGSSAAAAVRFGRRRTATAWGVRWYRYGLHVLRIRQALVCLLLLWALPAGSCLLSIAASIAIRPRRNKGEADMVLKKKRIIINKNKNMKENKN